ncbi:MAG: FKBP-type peptidyl-prolyl cis-trans isomerase [Burkholderiales bacterium]|jgi:FKBP-type peptidyl-prolyl cis-trans isomerase FkpA|nr:FKBP-type peptidyl-prolyl cis-trans isomerase [Burkholderiales bacterium]
MKHILAATFSALVMLVSGCGGGSSDTPPASGPTTLQISDTKVGTGATAANGNTVTVNYTGWLYDATAASFRGKQFDSSVGKAPFSFKLGVGQVIQGWDQGVVGMKVGGTRTLVIPSALGYGSAGAGGIIPGNTALVFTVDLLAVQ